MHAYGGTVHTETNLQYNEQKKLRNHETETVFNHQ
jgi:hypothetical protein